MKMKRFVAAAIAAVSCLSFAACGSDTASKDENVIHIMSSGDSSANMERALVDEYNKTADVKCGHRGYGLLPPISERHIYRVAFVRCGRLELPDI